MLKYRAIKTLPKDVKLTCFLCNSRRASVRAKFEDSGWREGQQHSWEVKLCLCWECSQLEAGEIEGGLLGGGVRDAL